MVVEYVKNVIIYILEQIKNKCAFYLEYKNTKCLIKNHSIVMTLHVKI